MDSACGVAARSPSATQTCPYLVLNRGKGRKGTGSQLQSRLAGKFASATQFIVKGCVEELYRGALVRRAVKGQSLDVLSGSSGYSDAAVKMVFMRGGVWRFSMP